MGNQANATRLVVHVSGFDAVELELKNNRKFRIGTDDPQQLLTAVRRVSQPDS
jgi:hypothetical protein